MQTFITSDPQPGDRRWGRVAGWFAALPDIDAKWSAVEDLAAATMSPDVLGSLAVYAFESIIDRTGPSLDDHLARAAQIPQVRMMLTCTVQDDPRVFQIVDRFRPPPTRRRTLAATPGNGSSGVISAPLGERLAGRLMVLA